MRLVEAFTTSKKPSLTELVLHFYGDYDERYDTGHHGTNISNVLKRLIKQQGGSYKCYAVPDKKLRKYVTSKSKASKGNYIRPDD